MKNLLSKQYFLSFFVLLLALCQSVSQVSAANWSSDQRLAYSSFRNVIAQPGEENAQLLVRLKENSTHALAAAEFAGLIGNTTTQLQVNPKADDYYFIPKRGCEFDTPPASQGIQTVARELQAVNATLQGKIDGLAADNTAIETAKTAGTLEAFTAAPCTQAAAHIVATISVGVADSLTALATKLDGEFLTVYNTNTAALDGIPAVVALKAQTTALRAKATAIRPLAQKATACDQLCRQAAIVHDAAPLAEQEAAQANHQVEATAQSARAQNAARLAKEAAQVLGIVIEGDHRAPIIQTIETDAARAQVAADHASALHNAVAGGPVDVKVFTRPLDGYAAQDVTPLDAAATKTYFGEAKIKETYKAVAHNLAIGMSSHLAPMQDETTLNALTTQLDADRVLIASKITASPHLSKEEKDAAIKHLNGHNALFGFVIQVIPRFIADEHETILDPAHLETPTPLNLTEEKLLEFAQNAAQTAHEAWEQKSLLEKWGVYDWYHRTTDGIGNAIAAATRPAALWTAAKESIAPAVLLGAHYAAYRLIPTGAANHIVSTLPLVGLGAYGLWTLYRVGRWAWSKYKGHAVAAAAEHDAVPVVVAPVVAPIVVPAPVHHDAVPVAAPRPATKGLIRCLGEGIWESVVDAAETVGIKVN